MADVEKVIKEVERIRQDYFGEMTSYEGDVLESAIALLKEMELYKDFFSRITSLAYGKECYFEEPNGLWYSRNTCKTMTLEDALDEAYGYIAMYLDE